MNINILNNVPEINVAVQKSNDGNFSILVTKKTHKTPLGRIRLGNVVKIGKREYIVLDHSAETTAVIEKNFAKKMEFGKDNYYPDSNVRGYCEGEYYDELCRAVGKENIVEHFVELTAEDGTGKTDMIKANVSILTTNLYRRYRKFLPKYGEWWWTATRVSADDSLEYTHSVCYIGANGVLDQLGCSCCGGVRPFCILNSSILVKENG